jgi:aspartyl-tRNA(Asn)/glutamyl-tRNA(Gln) amidotransferase subunit B
MKIGLEIHVQLPTKSKLFCTCSTTGVEPNTEVCPICLGFPGSRPSLNRTALEMGVRVAKFLECTVAPEIWFSRKTYFYPDLPKNFQITQYDSPIGTKGRFRIDGKLVGIWRVHLEEDPGRIRRVGKAGEEVSLIDYNRSGVPLLEIVTAPELSSPDEARSFLTELLVELRYVVGLTGSDEQTVRADANISVGEERVEVKNIQGMRNIERALRFEASRQTKMLDAGIKIVRETRRYDEERKVTQAARDKEQEEDYGYIGEPDLGTFDISILADSIVIPETPLKRADRLSYKYGVQFEKARQIVMTSMQLADLFEELCDMTSPDIALTWTLGPISSNWNSLRSSSEEARKQVVVAVMAFSRGEITDNEARRRIAALAAGECADDPSCAPGLEELSTLAAAYLDGHPQMIRDYGSNPRAANSAIGHIIKVTKGQFSSKDIVEAVKKEIEKRRTD